MPSELVASSFVLFLFNNISNPIIQIFFRSDLRKTLRAMFHWCCRKPQLSWRQKIATNSEQPLSSIAECNPPIILEKVKETESSTTIPCSNSVMCV